MVQTGTIPRTAPAAGLALALLAGATTASSQVDARAAFGEAIDVRVIGLEVVVTDREGERVTALGRDDFRILVDGEEVSIAYFDEVRDGAFAGAIDPAAPAADRSHPAGVPAEPPGSPPLASNHYLVFVDDAFSLDSRKSQVLERLRDQLSRLRPQDRVALLSFDGRRLRGVDRWLAPGEELDAAFDRVLAIGSRGIEVLAARRQGTYTPWLPGSTHWAAQGSEVGHPQSLFRQGLDRQVRSSLGNVLLAAVDSLRRLDAAPGRKSMLLLAGDWPPAAGVAPYGTVFDAPAAAPPEEAFDVFRPLVETANLLGWTLYTAPVSGFAPSSTDTMASAGAGRTNADRRMSDASAVHRAERAASGEGAEGELQIGVDANLRYLARETGGRAALYDRRFEALEIAIEDTRSYYSLGFEPVRRHDDRRHRITVEVLRPGLEARYRRGYLDLSAVTARALAGLAGSVTDPVHEASPR